MHLPDIRNLVSRIGLLVSVFVAIGSPVGYFMIESAALSEDLTVKATLSAGHAMKYIFTHDRLWQYQQVHLGDGIELPVNVGGPVRQRITDAAGKLVLEEEGTLTPPLRRYRVPLRITGTGVGWLEAEASLRPLIIRTCYVAAASSLLGLLAWLIVRTLPLRVLDRTLLRLSTQSARFQAALDN